jgi:hypothetical protein
MMRPVGKTPGTPTPRPGRAGKNGGGRPPGSPHRGSAFAMEPKGFSRVSWEWIGVFGLATMLVGGGMWAKANFDAREQVWTDLQQEFQAGRFPKVVARLTTIDQQSARERLGKDAALTVALAKAYACVRGVETLAKHYTDENVACAKESLKNAGATGMDGHRIKFLIAAVEVVRRQRVSELNRSGGHDDKIEGLMLDAEADWVDESKAKARTAYENALRVTRSDAEARDFGETTIAWFKQHVQKVFGASSISDSSRIVMAMGFIADAYTPERIARIRHSEM